jgi:hypothetical protein
MAKTASSAETIISGEAASPVQPHNHEQAAYDVVTGANYEIVTHRPPEAFPSYPATLNRHLDALSPYRRSISFHSNSSLVAAMDAVQDSNESIVPLTGQHRSHISAQVSSDSSTFSLTGRGSTLAIDKRSSSHNIDSTQNATVTSPSKFIQTKSFRRQKLLPPLPNMMKSESSPVPLSSLTSSDSNRPNLQSNQSKTDTLNYSFNISLNRDHSRSLGWRHADLDSSHMNCDSEIGNIVRSSNHSKIRYSRSSSRSTNSPLMIELGASVAAENVENLKQNMNGNLLQKVSSTTTIGCMKNDQYGKCLFLF